MPQHRCVLTPAGWRITGISLVLVLFAACQLASVSPARADSLHEIYEQLKDEEARIDAPQPVGAGRVGRFDVRSGEFRGPRTTVRFERDGNGKPRRIETRPVLRINGVRARLIFDFRNVVFTGSVTLTVNRVQRVLPAGRTRRVSVDIGRARSARWRITTMQGLEVSDAVNIRRPNIVGAGAFTLQAVPVAVLYEPPSPPIRRGTTVRLTPGALTSARASAPRSRGKTAPRRPPLLPVFRTSRFCAEASRA